MLAIFEKLKHRRKKSSKRLSFKSAVVGDFRISKCEKTKGTRTYKNNVESTAIKNRVLERANDYDRKYFPSESSEIKNRIDECEEARDTQTYKEKYLTNKNLSIITDDESDSSTERTFAAIKSWEKGLDKNDRPARRSLDEYVIVGIEEKPVTPSKKTANDNSDSESVKTRTESGSNCCPRCNNAWYAVFKRKVLRTNKISPCVITGIQETDGGFFENLGTLLAEKVRAQEQQEGPLPKKGDENQKTEEGKEEAEDDLSEEGTIEEPVEALLETDSDRDENEHATSFLAESMGWNVSHKSFFHRYIFDLDIICQQFALNCEYQDHRYICVCVCRCTP